MRLVEPVAYTEGLLGTCSSPGVRRTDRWCKGRGLFKIKCYDKFLEMHNLPRLNQEEIENMNRPLTSTEIETVI